MHCLAWHSEDQLSTSTLQTRSGQLLVCQACCRPLAPVLVLLGAPAWASAWGAGCGQAVPPGLHLQPHVLAAVHQPSNHRWPSVAGRRLCLMKPTALLINVSRGGLIGEYAHTESM